MASCATCSPWEPGPSRSGTQIRFGPLDDPRNRYLFNGVVSGIAGYGNAVGVPTVGGEIEFDPCYSGNPLVNVMCLGVLRREQLVLGTAGPPGTVAVLLGGATGRDGIGGASVLASASFDDESQEKRPSVQVGDPFEEKKLIEACLELYERGLVVGVQDLGAAGLSCATSEPAGRAGVGLDVDLDTVHVRETGMTAPELLMSESQERMMAFVPPDLVDEVLESPRMGDRVGRGGDGPSAVAPSPCATRARSSPRCPPHRWPTTHRSTTARAPTRIGWTSCGATPAQVSMATCNATSLLSLLDDPALGSTAWVHEQYDHMLFLNTVVGPGSDGALIRVRGTDKGLAVSTDGNGRLCLARPDEGQLELVYEAALNVAVTGARPLAVVDNLNFGNPEKPEVMWQFEETVEGISSACEALGIPVVGGNVSFYNETDGIDINPTPVVGLLGLADPMPATPPRLSRAEEGMEIWEIGPQATGNLSGSAAQRVIHDELTGRPTPPDPDAAKRVIALAAELAHRVPVLHDISDGGLAVAVAEVCIASGIGATLTDGDNARLFSEDPHRLIAVFEANTVELPVDLSRKVGSMGGEALVLGLSEPVEVQELTDVFEGAIPRRMAG